MLDLAGQEWRQLVPWCARGEFTFLQFPATHCDHTESAFLTELFLAVFCNSFGTVFCSLFVFFLCFSRLFHAFTHLFHRFVFFEEVSRTLVRILRYEYEAPECTIECNRPNICNNLFAQTPSANVCASLGEK